MAETGRYFVEWKEQFVSQERGKRVVHYFLKDSSGESILAVVGTERSVRHMFYVVAEDFVQSCGDEHSIHAGFKWRSRREVVDWLTSMLSKQHVHRDQSNSPTSDLGHALKSTEWQMQDRFSGNLNGHSSDIVWSGVAWTCGKQLKHYPSFCRNGIAIMIQSFVFVMAKGENRYLAYLEDMYEDKRGHKKVKVRWFHHNQEVKGVLPLKNIHPREVFITPYSQVISAECVDGSAIVLTREHYEECFSAFPKALSNRLHVCFRQFRGNKVKPFDLQKLRGYYDQPILSFLKSNKPVPEADSMGYSQQGEDDEEMKQDEKTKVGAERTGVGVSAEQIMAFGSSYLNFTSRSLGKRLPPLMHLNGSKFKVGENIELLCQDSGIRGCWFRCTVVQLSKRQIKLQYDDLQDEDENRHLEEWVPAFKLAAADKLGMRHHGRPTIRPVPPPNAATEVHLNIGYAVDAWWSDGWWEGVVTGITSDDSVQVYFPGERFFMKILKKDLRISRDWVGDQWLEIKAKPEILSVISSEVGSEANNSMFSNIANQKTSSEVGSEAKNSMFSNIADEKFDGITISQTTDPNDTKPSNKEAEMPDMAATLICTESLPEDMDVDDVNNTSPLNNKASKEDLNEHNVNCRSEDGVSNDNKVDTGSGVHDNGKAQEEDVDGDNMNHNGSDRVPNDCEADASSDVNIDGMETEVAFDSSGKDDVTIEPMEITASREV